MDGYKLLSKYFDGLSGTAIEIGSERGHGSTEWIANFLKGTSIEFNTIDPDRNQFNNAKTISGAIPHHCTGEEWLSRYNKNDICFGYIDGADHHGGCRGIEVDAYSVRSHLDCSVLIESRTADKCVLIFDDTNYSVVRCIGKGAFGVPYLIGRGFEVVDAFYYTPESDDQRAYLVMKRDKHG